MGFVVRIRLMDFIGSYGDDDMMNNKETLFNLTEAQRIWLEKVCLKFLAGEEIDNRILKSELFGTIPRDFDPKQIDERLLKIDRPTLVGLYYFSPQKDIIKQADKIVKIIQGYIITNPRLKEIDLNLIANELGIRISYVKDIIRLINDLGYFWSSLSGNIAGISTEAFDTYYKYEDIENLIAEFIARDPQKHPTVIALAPSLNTSLPQPEVTAPLDTHKHNKKYQIFISSTYKDLVAARQKVVEAILRVNHFPIGMEMFSAADEEQWEIIKRTIDCSDYYVLIIGHRYGSQLPDNVSYTEKEYDYAKSKGIPVMAFVRRRQVPTIPDEREIDSDKIQRLDSFISKAQGNMCDFWSNVDELAALVTQALWKMMDQKPRTGWIRADRTVIQQSKASMTDFQIKIKLKEAIKDFEHQILNATSISFTEKATLSSMKRFEELFENVNLLGTEFYNAYDGLKEIDETSNSGKHFYSFYRKHKADLSERKILESGKSIKWYEDTIKELLQAPKVKRFVGFLKAFSV